jgi:hypothetical protein
MPITGLKAARMPGQMGAVAHLIGLVNQAGELVVKLAGRMDAELVNVQSFGVRAGSGDAGVVHPPLQVQVSAQRAVTRPGAGEAAARLPRGESPSVPAGVRRGWPQPDR